MRIRLTSTRGPAHWVSRYGLAIASVALALLVTASLKGSGIRGVLFVPAILISAWYGGTGPGLLAVVLSVLGIDLFLTGGDYSRRFASIDDALYLFVFSVSALLIAWLTGTQRRTDDALRQAHEELTDQMQELEMSTEQLQAEIVERKRVGAEVAKQASLLEQSHDAIFVWDFPGTITYWSHGAEQLYGFSKEEATGRLSHELLRTQHPMPTALFEATIEREGLWSGELTHTTRDGRQVIVDSRQVLMRQADGRRLVLETNRDITERKQGSEALEQAQAQLAHVTRVTMLGEITASIAHEVNQPLAAVVMNGNACLRWLASDPPNLAEAREAAQRIVSDGNRAGQVIARVRALMKREPSRKSALDVNDVIAETLTFTRTEIARQGVSVRTELRENLPTVVGDRVQLQQVLVNLILNGIDAMSAVTERPRVLTILSRREGAGSVLLEVTDCGIGLTPGQSERMFDAFFSTKPGGLGIGLSVSRSIVELHGGRISVTPNDGPGVTMQLSLPAASGGG